MNTEIKSAEEDLILKIVEQWGNAICSISEMVKWVKESRHNREGQHN